MKGLKKARMTSKKTSNYKSRPKRLTRRLIGGKDPSIFKQPPQVSAAESLGWTSPTRWIDIAMPAGGRPMYIFDRETHKFLGFLNNTSVT